MKKLKKITKRLSKECCLVCKKKIKGHLILFSGHKFDKRECVSRFKNAHARMVCEFC